MLVKILSYAYAVGIPASRQIALELEEHVAFHVLALGGAARAAKHRPAACRDSWDPRGGPEARRQPPDPRVAPGPGPAVGTHRVARLVRAGRIRAKTVKKWRATTDSAQPYPVVPNTRTRPLAVAAPNRVVAGAITYVRTVEGGRSLAVGRDLSSRRVMAWGGRAA